MVDWNSGRVDCVKSDHDTPPSPVKTPTETFGPQPVEKTYALASSYAQYARAVLVASYARVTVALLVGLPRRARVLCCEWAF